MDDAVTLSLLTRDELGSLCELTNGGLQRIIPFAHELKLLDLDLATRSLSGLRLTEAGARLASSAGSPVP